MTLFRPEIEALEQNGITGVALPRLGRKTVRRSTAGLSLIALIEVECSVIAMNFGPLN